MFLKIWLYFLLSYCDAIGKWAVVLLCKLSFTVSLSLSFAHDCNW